MKVLVVHNLHRSGSASGDDQVFKNETRLLEDNGIPVLKYTVINDKFDQAGILGKIAMTCGMLWSFKNYKKITEIIKKEKPDIMHVHTFFPLLSPSILYAAKKNGVKVVATLHDTRFICPCATSLRDNKICNLCSDGKYFRMVRYGCFKGSRIMSAIVAFIFKYHRIRRSFYRNIDKYICLNDQQIKLLRKTDFPEEKLVKKYNCVADGAAQSSNDLKEYSLPSRFAVFYGRIGEEKGIRVLQEAWEQISNIPLVVMGGGPLEREFSDWAQTRKNIYYLGYVPHEKCMTIAQKAEFGLMPSIWYEGCSMVAIETESLGIPLIATDIGFLREAVKEGYNGLKFPLGDAERFREAVEKLWKDQDIARLMGKHAREDYEEKYKPEDNLRQLLEIYQEVIN